MLITHCSIQCLLNLDHHFSEMRPSSQVIQCLNSLTPFENLADNWLDLVLRNEIVKSLEHFQAPNSLPVKLYGREFFVYSHA